MAALLGKVLPRIFTPPLIAGTPGPCGCGCALSEDTTLGFAVAEFALGVLEIPLLPWQRWLLIHALEVLPDRTFRFRTVVVLVARQNGKSTLAQVLALFALYVLQVALVIGTAQNLDIAEEVWAGAVQIAEETPELREEIKRVVQVNGKKALELHGGPRYKVQAANRRGGRGLSGDLVIMDELREHHTWDAWGAVTKTTLARPFAQIWALSNAGDSASVPLRHLRKQAHAQVGDPDGLNQAVAELPGMEDPVAAVEAINAAEEIVAAAADSLGIFEWSAPPECRLDDPDAIAQANPSLGHTITMRAVLSSLATDPEHVYRTEVLCQWIEGTVSGPFPPGAWEAGTDPLSSVPEGAALWWGVDVAHDRSRAHIAVVGERSDGDWHAEVVASRTGTEWVKSWLAERAAKVPITLAVQGRGAPVTTMIDDLRTIAGVTLVECVGVELGKGTGRTWDAVAAHTPPAKADDPTPRKLWHRPQPILDQPAGTAATRPLGDGAWGWDRARSPIDSAPLVAVTMALWLATRTTEPERRSAYDEGSSLLILD